MQETKNKFTENWDNQSRFFLNYSDNDGDYKVKYATDAVLKDVFTVKTRDEKTTTPYGFIRGDVTIDGKDYALFGEEGKKSVKTKVTHNKKRIYIMYQNEIPSKSTRVSYKGWIVDRVDVPKSNGLEDIDKLESSDSAF